MESASHSVKFYSPGVIKDTKTNSVWIFFSCIVNNTVGKKG